MTTQPPDAPRAYPLVWPTHRPRTLKNDRRAGKFRVGGDDISMPGAVDRLNAELGRIGALYPVLSTNVPLRRDGRPLSAAPDDNDPGAVAYFHLRGKPFALACDTYTWVEMNVAALAAHVEATRAIERHGVASAAETLQAFSALPPPADFVPKRPWWEVFGVMRELADADTLQALYRIKAAKAHPDKGGSVAAMSELNTARAEALKEIGR